MIVCGFPGTGKSMMAKFSQWVDLESTPFKKNWLLYAEVAKHMSDNGYTGAKTVGDGKMSDLIDRRSELCKTCIHTKVCSHDKNLVGDVFVMGHPMFFDNDKLYEEYKERERQGFPCEDYMPTAEPEIIRCKDCKYWNELLCECDRRKPPLLLFGTNDFCSKAERRTE